MKRFQEYSLCRGSQRELEKLQDTVICDIYMWLYTRKYDDKLQYTIFIWILVQYVRH